jgi:ribosome recycling factor
MLYKYLSAQNILNSYHHTLSVIRSGRVNASVLDQIEIEAYGNKMAVREVATISQPEPSQLLITPFDKSLVKAIVKSINDSNLGVNPIDDGAGVRLNFPPLTEESRKIRVKEVYKLMEEARVVVRNQRHDLIKKWKNEKEQGLIGEDVLNRQEKELQTEVDKINQEIEKITKDKEEELMKI